MEQKASTLKQVTTRIIELLEKVDNGDIIYWIPLSGLASNPSTKHVYSNLNQLLLSLELYNQDYHHNQWLTFTQIKKGGGHVVKGAKATQVTFTSRVYRDQDGQVIAQKAVDALLLVKPPEDTILKFLGSRGITVKRFLKLYHVFNVAQTQELDSSITEATLARFETKQKIRGAELLVGKTGAKVVQVSANSAHYDRKRDKIQVPFPAQFPSSEEYYKTVFHELIHWTGHENRLNRKLGSTRGDQSYAFEELVAELGSVFICAQLDIRASLTSSAAYVKSWLGALNNDPTYIMKAVAKANQAMQFIIQTEKVGS